MTKMIKRIVRCDKCNKDYEIDVYESINVSDNPKLKSKVLNDKIYEFVCPHCGEKHNLLYPFTYIDSDKKYMIDMGPLAENVQYYLDVVQPSQNNVEKDFPGAFNGFIHLSVTTYGDLLSNIIVLDNGLDYRIASLYNVYMESFTQKGLMESKEYKNKNPFIRRSFFEMNDDKLVTIVLFDINNNEDNHKGIVYDFDRKMYDNIYNGFINNVNDVFTYCFNRDIAYKMLSIDDDKVEDYKNTIMEMAIIELKDGIKKLAFVPEFNENKYQVGDFVCTMKKRYIEKGRIINIFHMSRYAIPVDLDDLPVVAYKTSDVELLTTMGSKDELDNKEVREIFKKYYKDKNTDYEKLCKANVLIGQVIETDFSSFLKSMNSDGTFTLDNNNFKAELIKHKDEKYPDGLLCLYLDQSELSNDDASRFIYNFDDMVKIVINNPDRFDGIIINPESDKLIFDNRILIDYKHNKVMTNSDLMRELLPRLKEEEIAYMSKFYYDVICKVYFEETSPHKVADDMGKSFEEIDKALGQGYCYLKHIVRDNYDILVRDDKISIIETPIGKVRPRNNN